MSRYIPSLGVVLVSVVQESIKLPKTVPIIIPTANMSIPVQFEGCGFRPSIGSTLQGRIVACTATNIFLLIHNTFNASISIDHIPGAAYVYDEDRPQPPAYNEQQPADDFFAKHWRNVEGDSIFAGDASPSKSRKGADEETTDGVARISIASPSPEPVEEQINADDAYGCWIDQSTGEPLAAADALLSFTVIG